MRAARTRHPCHHFVRCSEFYVTRERILARPRSFYLRAIAWIKLVTALPPHKGGMSSYQAGVVFENLW